MSQARKSKENAPLIHFRVHTRNGYRDVRATDPDSAREQVHAPGVFITKVKVLK